MERLKTKVPKYSSKLNGETNESFKEVIQFSVFSQKIQIFKQKVLGHTRHNTTVSLRSTLTANYQS